MLRVGLRRVGELQWDITHVFHDELTKRIELILRVICKRHERRGED